MNTFLINYWFRNEIEKMLTFFPQISLEWVDVDYYGEDLDNHKEKWSVECKFEYHSLMLKNVCHTWVEVYNEQESLKEGLDKIADKLSVFRKEMIKKEGEKNAEEN